jgi:hypothetical protein
MTFKPYHSSFLGGWALPEQGGRPARLDRVAANGRFVGKHHAAKARLQGVIPLAELGAGWGGVLGHVLEDLAGQENGERQRSETFGESVHRFGHGARS